VRVPTCLVLVLDVLCAACMWGCSLHIAPFNNGQTTNGAELYLNYTKPSTSTRSTSTPLHIANYCHCVLNSPSPTTHYLSPRAWGLESWDLCLHIRHPRGEGGGTWDATGTAPGFLGAPLQAIRACLAKKPAGDQQTFTTHALRVLTQTPNAKSATALLHQSPPPPP
jgi:hypothetical protein